jgi:hypothetical protein
LAGVSRASRVAHPGQQGSTCCECARCRHHCDCRGT